MWRFIFGLAIGFLAGRLIKPGTIDVSSIESGLGDIQKRTEAVLIESRRILEETRQELAAAMEASRSSVQGKAERIRTAATEPESVVGQQEEGKTVRPSKVE